MMANLIYIISACFIVVGEKRYTLFLLLETYVLGHAKQYAIVVFWIIVLLKTQFHLYCSSNEASPSVHPPIIELHGLNEVYMFILLYLITVHYGHLFFFDLI